MCSNTVFIKLVLVHLVMIHCCVKVSNPLPSAIVVTILQVGSDRFLHTQLQLRLAVMRESLHSKKSAKILSCHKQCVVTKYNVSGHKPRRCCHAFFMMCMRHLTTYVGTKSDEKVRDSFLSIAVYHCFVAAQDNGRGLRRGPDLQRTYRIPRFR